MISIRQVQLVSSSLLALPILYALLLLQAPAQQKQRTTKQFDVIDKVIAHDDLLRIDFIALGENDKINIRPTNNTTEISILHLVPSACKTCAFIYEPGEKINDIGLSITGTAIRFERPSNISKEDSICIDIAIRPNTRVNISINGNSRLALGTFISQPLTMQAQSLWGKGTGSRNKFFALSMTRFTPEQYDKEKNNKKP